MTDQNRTQNSDVDAEISELMAKRDNNGVSMSARSFAEGDREPVESVPEIELESTQMVVDEEPEQGEAEEETAPTLNQLFAGNDSVRLRIAPRIMLNVSRETADVPDVVRIGDAFYSVNSPMRKGIGKKNNPYGLIRDNLAELARYVDRMSDRSVVFFGPASNTEDRVTAMMDHMNADINNIMYGAFPDPSNPVFKFIELHQEEETEDTEEDDEDGLDSVGVTEVNATASPTTHTVPAEESYHFGTWAVFDTDEDGTIVIRPTIAVNVKMPLLVGSSSLIKPFATIQRIISNYAKAASMEEDDFRLTFAFSSEDLLDSAVVELLQHYSVEEGSEAVIISTNYLHHCAVDLDNDIYRLFPAGNTAQQAAALLMPENSDILLMV